MSSSTLAERFDRVLAPYAVKNAGKHHREYPEKEMLTKLPFQRDRDRVIHCKAFRRLRQKTQVIVNPKDDHFRNRLSHTLEGSQIGRGICRALQLNEDLAEAAMLAHDLGHPPFGHEGEFALNEIITPLGYKFDHNKHGYRIVTKLERNYPDFPGLNLTEETLTALQKHETPWGNNGETKLPHKFHLEAQVIDLADEIAYYSHDIDDALRAGFLTFDDFYQVKIGAKVRELIKTRYPNIDENNLAYQPQIIRSVIHILISDIINHTKERLEAFNINTLDKVYALNIPIVTHSDEIAAMKKELKETLFAKFYHSDTVLKHTEEGKDLLKELYTRLHDSPQLMPEKTRSLIDNPDPLAIVVKDYIAGMTDPFAKDLVLRLRQSLI